MQSACSVCASEMSNAEVIASRLLSFNQMYSYEKRLQTFSEWPFREDCQCTPELVRASQKGGKYINNSLKLKWQPIRLCWVHGLKQFYKITAALIKRSNANPLFRWPRQVLCTVLVRTSQTWPAVSTVSESWRAGSQKTTPGELLQHTFIIYRLCFSWLLFS